MQCPWPNKNASHVAKKIASDEQTKTSHLSYNNNKEPISGALAFRQ